MLKSIYTPTSGALALEKTIDVLSNNLANVNTVGFKQDHVTFKEMVSEPSKNYPTPFPPAEYKVNLAEIMPLNGNEISYVGIDGIHRDGRVGPEVVTNKPYDMMIQGEGYFIVNTKEGPRYTRSGNFTLNSQGTLVSQEGNPILGEKGTISLFSQNFEVTRNGDVIVDGEVYDKLKVVRFVNDDFVERVGGNKYFYKGPENEVMQVAEPNVIQGSLEGSNVNAIKNLTQLIIAHRAFEAYSKAIKNYDSMMEKSSNTIGDSR